MDAPIPPYFIDKISNRGTVTVNNRRLLKNASLTQPYAVDRIYDTSAKLRKIVPANKMEAIGATFMATVESCVQSWINSYEKNTAVPATGKIITEIN